jgi:hypothetical protein
MKPKELERLLRLAPGESLLGGAEQSLPTDERARGYAAERLEDIAARLESEGDVRDVLEGQGCIVQHLQWALGAYFVAPANDAQRLEVVSGAYLELGGGDMLLNGRERPAVLRVAAPGERERIYVLEYGRAEVWSVARSSSLLALVQLQIPELGELTGGSKGDTSLEAEFEHLRKSTAAVERLAAPGLLLRFWVPTDRQTRARRVTALAVTESPLLVAVKRWYASLPETTRLAAQDTARAELQRLEDLLLHFAAADDVAQKKGLGTRLALERDRLESIRRLIVAAGDAAALTPSVMAFDDRVATQLTALAEFGVADERLRRVFVAEPEAWWGAIAG